MKSDDKQLGEVFSRAYLERGSPANDSAVFRNRLEAYFLKNHVGDYPDIASYIKQEGGLIAEMSYQQNVGIYYNFPKFWGSAPIEEVLSAITFIWRYLYKRYEVYRRAPNGSQYLDHIQANNWREFVERAMREENMAYTLDEKCGVHYHVDEEFERNRYSALSALGAQRYSGARVAFDAAYKYLDAQPSDTKAAVRSAFEAVEVLARLIVPEAKNLNKWLVENKLKPIALASLKDVHEIEAVTRIFDGIAQWVDALHYYRHGQGVEHAVAPTLAMTVYAMSSAAAILRWLVELDTKGKQA